MLLVCRPLADKRLLVGTMANTVICQRHCSVQLPVQNCVPYDCVNGTVVTGCNFMSPTLSLYMYASLHLLSIFLPARRYASACNSDRNVSVRPSVTRRYCVKTKKASGMISSPSGSPKTLVFRRKNFITKF